eukprot:9288943-Prorocentrum_lima.AAC.1
MMPHMASPQHPPPQHPPPLNEELLTYVSQQQLWVQCPVQMTAPAAQSIAVPVMATPVNSAA